VPRPDYYGNPAGVTEDIEVVRAVFTAFAARDLDAALPYVSPDCEFELKGTAERIGRTQPYRGHAGLREYFADVSRAWDELVLHADDFRAIPGSVIVMGHVEALRDGVLHRRAVLWTWKLRDGLATSIRVADMGELPG
jgi:ketosteroid isomerase-like protein